MLLCVFVGGDEEVVWFGFYLGYEGVDCWGGLYCFYGGVLLCEFGFG